MSLLSRILGRRTPAPPPPPPPAVASPAPPPPPPPPPSDTLVLTGEGLDGATGPVEVTLTIGDRTFTASATRRGSGTTFPAEFAVSGFDEIVAVPEEIVAVPDEIVAVPDEVVAAPEPAFVADVQDSHEIAVVRRPLTDADGSVVGYELVVDDVREGPEATAGLLLDAFGDIGLERLAGRRPVWVTMTTEFLLE